mgnify:CR=1 FL=1
MATEMNVDVVPLPPVVVVLDFDLTMTMEHTGGYPQSIVELYRDSHRTILFENYYDDLLATMQQLVDEFGVLFFINSRGIQSELDYVCNGVLFPKGLISGIFGAKDTADLGQSETHWAKRKAAVLQRLLDEGIAWSSQDIYFLDDTDTNIEAALQSGFVNSFCIKSRVPGVLAVLSCLGQQLRYCRTLVDDVFSSYPYAVHIINNDQAEMVLLNTESCRIPEGSRLCLLHYSEDTLTLSIVEAEEIKHYSIVVEGGVWKVETFEYSSIQDLISSNDLYVLFASLLLYQTQSISSN